MKVLLDTHVLLWWQAGGERLSRSAQEAIDTAEAILLSPLSFWEVTTLVRLGRVQLDRPVGDWVQGIVVQHRIAIADLTVEAASWAGDLPQSFPGDPIDRLLYATARDLRVPMVTKDEALRLYADAGTDVTIVW